jgi:DNA repair protein RadA/Sms
MFICSKCKSRFDKYSTQCPECKRWNCFDKLSQSLLSNKGEPKLLKDIEISDYSKIKTDIAEFDFALDGGINPGFVYLLSGEPGIGKSTLLLLVTEKLSKYGKVVYLSAEEPESQIRKRAERIGVDISNPNIFILSEPQLSKAENHILNISPSFVITDSIQAIYETDSIGNIAFQKEAMSRFYRLAHSLQISFFIICHVTKDGDIAGPKALEHFADCVCSFDNDRNTDIRCLRVVKNRDGKTPCMGTFRMTKLGLVSESNPIESYNKLEPGSSIGVIVEDGKIIPCIIQAISIPADNRKVNVSGFKTNRVNQILAILTNKKLIDPKKEYYINALGGISISDTQSDLAIAAAIISNKNNIELPKKAFIGELDLMGKVIKKDSEALFDTLKRFDVELWEGTNVLELEDINGPA